MRSSATRITGPSWPTSGDTRPKRPSPLVRARGRPPDWAALQRQADARLSRSSDNNEFGLDNQRWDRELREEMLRQRNTRSDEAFLAPSERTRNGSTWSSSCASSTNSAPGRMLEHADPRPLV